MNAKQTLEINVTQAHIDAGRPTSQCGCPIALACRDAGITASISPTQIFVLKTDKTYPLPAIAKNFIDDFDNFESVQPFRFTIEIRTKN